MVGVEDSGFGHELGRGDCAVRCVSLLTGENYSDVLLALSIAQKKNASRGTDRYAIRQLLLNKGFTFYKFTRHYSVKRVHEIIMRNMMVKLCTYAVFTSAHIAAVIDNTLHDVFDSRRKRVEEIAISSETNDFMKEILEVKYPGLCYLTRGHLPGETVRFRGVR